MDALVRAELRAHRRDYRPVRVVVALMTMSTTALLLAAGSSRRAEVHAGGDPRPSRFAAVLVGALAVSLVGCFLVSNTLAALMARRARSLAVMRAVGATAGDLRRLVVAEAIAATGPAALGGTVVGAGLAFPVSRWLSSGLAAGPASRGLELPTVLLPFLAPAAALLVVSLAAARPAALGARGAPAAAGRSSARRPLGATLVAVGVPFARGAAGRDAVRDALRSPERSAHLMLSLMLGVELVAMLTIYQGGSDGSVAAGRGFVAVAVAVALVAIGVAISVPAGDRTGEIALVRAVGATAREVRRALLAEGALMGLGAGLVGVLVASGFMLAITGVGGFHVPVLTLLALVGVATGGGAWSAHRPATRAAARPAIAALRVE